MSAHDSFPVTGPYNASSFVEGEMSSDSEAHSQGSVDSESTSESWTETTVPFYEFSEREQTSSRQFYPLEELLHRAKVYLKTLSPRRIALKARGTRTKILTVPFVDDVPEIAEYKEAARHKIFSESGKYATIDEVLQEQQERIKELTYSKKLDNPTDF